MEFRIREVLKEKCLTALWLSSQVGITQPNMSNIVSGKNRPSLDTLEKIASALNVPIVELFQCPQAAHQSGHIACPYCGAVIELSAGKASGSNP